jgi:CRP-like cAMP-binding protein
VTGDLHARPRTTAFRWLGPEALAHVAATSRLCQLPAGRVIFRKGDAADGCYLILKGAVKVSLPLADGQEALLAILGQGDVAGEMALIDDLPRSATVITAKASELWHLSRQAFDRLAHTDIAVYQQLLRLLSARLRANNERYLVQRMPLGCRLACTFLHLAQSFGEHLPDRRILIRHKVSQAELALLIGAARENVNRQLAEWRKSGLLSRISGYYCLSDASSLEPLARGDAAR